jgi:hypothetical protein
MWYFKTDLTDFSFRIFTYISYTFIWNRSNVLISIPFQAFSVGLDGPGNKSQWGEIFHTGPGAHQAAYTRDTRSLSGAKRPEPVVVHPLPSTAYVKKRVELKFLLLLCSFMVGYMAKLIF